MSRNPDSAPGEGTVGSLIIGFLVTSMLAGVLSAGLFLPFVGAAGQVARGGIGFFDALPAEFALGTLSQQSKLLWSDGTPMATFYYQNRILVPLEQVAPVMRQSIVAIEDERFYAHNGIDPEGIARAVVKTATGSTEGASTLTQQWIKNVLLDQAIAADDKAAIQALQNPDKGRKVREIKLALAAEKKYSKDQILENYLNIALFGDGQYGIQTASRHFLSKNASELTLADAAMLAGMIRSPSYYNPLKYPDRAQSRRNVVLDSMLGQKIITKEQWQEATSTPIATQIKPENTTNGCEFAGNAGFFCDYVTKVILNDPAFGPDVATRRQLLYRGGLTITTTLDPRRQTLAQEAVNDRVAPDDSSQVGVALSSVDSTTGQIVAMAQNRTFDPSPDAPPGFGALNYNVDKIYGGGVGFQPGSTYKPFTLATWLSSGRSLNDVVNADRRSYNVARFHARCDDGTMGGRYSPANAEGSNKGNITVMQATYGSVNTAYMQMAYKLDLCDIRDTAASLGVHRADGQPLVYYPSAVLGTNEIAPLAMASAYGGFANGGIYCSPIAIISVTDAAGKVLPKPEANCHEVLDPDVVANLNSALQQVLIQGTARGTYIGRPAAGKTGTTNDSTETWFTGYTAGGLSTAVWVGTPNPEPSSLNGIRINGRYHGRVYGATLALPTWKAYMSDAVDGMEVKSFAEASQDAEAQHQVTVPRVIGKTEDEAREAIQSQDLADGPLVLVDSAQPAGTIIGTSPKSGSRVTTGTEIRILVSNGIPPTGATGAPPPPSGGSPPTTADGAPVALGPQARAPDN